MFERTDQSQFSICMQETNQNQYANTEWWNKPVGDIQMLKFDFFLIKAKNEIKYQWNYWQNEVGMEFVH